MRFHALACDYDGTIATEGRVPPQVIEALEQLKRSGRSLVLVTGRTHGEWLRLFPDPQLFARVILENGGVLFRPETGELETLARRPPPAFVQRLKDRGVTPLVEGKIVVATLHPHETTVLETIRDLGLEMHVVFNKGAVMALPSGVNKASGLAAALDELKLSRHNVVGVGDAENDHAFLERCECAVAVANALPSLKEKADWITRAPEGAGVVEIVKLLLENDFKDADTRLLRHRVALGESAAGGPLLLSPYGRGVLIAGPSGCGKSTLAGGVIERLRNAGYQLCVIDPEGDFQDVEGLTALGARDRIPAVKEAMEVLNDPRQNLALNLLGIPLESRPPYFQELLPALTTAQGRTGRPHWIVIDEVHHLFPNAGPSAGWTLPARPEALMLITVDPAQVSPDVRPWIDVAVLLGDQAGALLNSFLKMQGQAPIQVPSLRLRSGEALVWLKDRPTEAVVIRGIPATFERKRHVRKYAEGDVGPDKSFYFRGPEGKLNLRAQNLVVFLQMADGVDDGTWEYHRRRGDYSQWFRDAIKDVGLSNLAREVESSPVAPAESRAMIRKLVEDQYTSPV